MKNYLKFPLPTGIEWFRLPERVKALEDVPVPYKVYTALLSQRNENPPIAIVLENTIGEISFTYNDIGFYSCVSNDKFTEEKTAVFIGSNQYIESATDVHSNYLLLANTSEIYITSYYNNFPEDNQLDYGGPSSIEIRVYN